MAYLWAHGRVYAPNPRSSSFEPKSVPKPFLGPSKSYLQKRSLQVDLSCGVLVGVLDLITPTSARVVKFELCASQKCYATMRISLTCLGVPHAINNEFKWAGSIITRVRPFFLFIKKKKKSRLKLCLVGGEIWMIENKGEIIGLCAIW